MTLGSRNNIALGEQPETVSRIKRENESVILSSKRGLVLSRDGLSVLNSCVDGTLGASRFHFSSF